MYYISLFIYLYCLYLSLPTTKWTPQILGILFGVPIDVYQSLLHSCWYVINAQVTFIEGINKSVKVCWRQCLCICVCIYVLWNYLNILETTSYLIQFLPQWNWILPKFWFMISQHQFLRSKMCDIIVGKKQALIKYCLIT